MSDGTVSVVLSALLSVDKSSGLLFGATSLFQDSDSKRSATGGLLFQALNSETDSRLISDT